MVVSDEVVGVALVAGALILLLVGAALVVLALRLRLTRRQLARAVRVLPGQPPEASSGRAVDAEVTAISRIGLVRYDAFHTAGGALSFSAALLDDRGDGIVLSAVNGRSEGRTYAKAVVGGVSEQELSPEEREAIEDALHRARPDGPRRRSRRARVRASS